MATKRQPLLFALDQNGDIKHIDEVERGDACNCSCPACGEKLVAKKGDRRLKIHHFAHAAGVDCEHGYESSLHLAAKRILEKTEKIVLPASYVSFPDSPKKRVLLYNPTEICIDSIELETPLGNIIPDVLIKSGERRLSVEIFVSHPVDQKKQEKIEKENISTIEINCSEMDCHTPLEELYRVLLSDSPQKNWVYNAREKEWYNRFYNCAKKYSVKTLSSSSLEGEIEAVFDCPIPTRKLDHNMCADYWHDCVRCPYCVKIERHMGKVQCVYCTGEEGIAECEDFSLNKSERIERNKKKTTEPFLKRIEETKKFLSEGRVVCCPNCGYALKEKKGKLGKYWGCFMTPHCNFVIWYNAETNKYQYSNN